MNKALASCALLSCFLAGGIALPAQTFPTPRYFGQLIRGQHPPTQVAGPEGLEDYISQGKLTLSLQDAIRLMLLNNTEVRMDRLNNQQSQYSLMSAYGPFDPVLQASFQPQRSTQPTTSSLSGAQTLSNLQQPVNLSYNQLFQTGTNLNIGLSGSRSATNSTFATFNPSFATGLTFTLGQPLLRGRGLAITRAPILVAQRNINQSRAVFHARLSDAILNVINQYWAVVQAQKSLAVVQDSLHLAEESYQRDKRALELGALPPLDIYRSESTVAQRRLQAIQSEYALKPLEDQLRRTIGADLDSRAGALDLMLTEDAEPKGELANQDIPTALQLAWQNRPELESIHMQLAVDDINAHVAGNNLKPDLNLSGFYTSNGIGGVGISTSSGSPVVVSQGGFLDSLNQVGSFNFPTYGVSLNLRLPVRNHAAEAQLGTSLVTKRNDLYALRQTQQQINQDVRNAIHQLEASKIALSAASTSRDLAAKTLAAEEKKFQLGAETIFFVLDAQNTLEQAKQSYVQAEIDYQRAVALVDRVTGNNLAKNQVLIDNPTP